MNPAMNKSTKILAELGAATVYEASGRKGLIDIPLISIVPGSKVAGPARIAACGQGDNRAVHEVMAYADTGDILILTMPIPEPVALLGELLASQAHGRKVVGVLVDGSVRDIESLRALGLPIWTRYIRVRGATKDKRGCIDVPVIVGGCLVNPGDIVVLDDDGAVVVARSDVDLVIQASEKRVQKESALLERFRTGELSYDIYGLRALDNSETR